MKKYAVLWCAVMFFFSLGTGMTAQAKVSFEEPKDLPLTETPRDIAFSRDGSTAYILGQKSILLYSMQEAKVVDTIPLKKSFSRITLSPDESMFYLLAKDSPQMSTLAFSQIFNIEAGASPVIGNQKARVTITAFLDYQCPYCAKVYPLLQELLKKYPNDVKLVIKHFPLPMHKFAEKAALAALAAARQGKYEKVTELFFANFGALNDDSIHKFVADAGADMQKFDQDLTNPALRQQIEQDQNAGRLARVRAVPSLFINGISPKNRSLEGFSQIIDQELKKNK